MKVVQEEQSAITTADAGATASDMSMETTLMGLKDGTVSEADVSRTMDRLVESKLNVLKGKLMDASARRTWARMLEASSHYAN